MAVTRKPTTLSRRRAAVWFSVIVVLGAVVATVTTLVAVCTLSADETLDERRQRLAAMTLEEKDQLARLHQRFTALSEEQQEQMRRLHAELRTDPQADELRLVMRRYRQWLETLPLENRVGLSQLPQQERLNEVVRLRTQEIEARAQRIADEDIQAIVDWLQARYLARLPKDRQEEMRKRMAEMSLTDRVMTMSRDWRRLFLSERSDPFDLEGFAELEPMLSPSARETLSAAPDLNAKRRVLYGWFGHLWRDIYVDFQEQARRIDEKELAAYFEQLPPARRDELLDLPPGDLQQELRRDFLRVRMMRRRNGGDEATSLEQPAEPAEHQSASP